MRAYIKEVQILCFIYIFLTVKVALQSSGSNKANFSVVNIVAENYLNLRTEWVFGVYPAQFVCQTLNFLNLIISKTPLIMLIFEWLQERATYATI